MTYFTATITIPITANVPTTETTKTAISNIAYDATEPSLATLEDTGHWSVQDWGWYDVWPGEDIDNSIILMEGTLNTTVGMQADNELEVFDYFTENYHIPELNLPSVFGIPQEFFVSKITDEKTTWEYDDRGFIVWCSEWKPKP